MLFFNRIDYLTLSFYKNMIIGMVKILLGMLTHSVLVFANAFYNIILCVGKMITILNRDMNERAWKKKFDVIDTAKGKEKESSGIFLGVTIIFLGIVFLLASMHTFATKEMNNYHWVGVYLITLCTFIKLGVSAYGLIKCKDKGHSFFSIKLTNLADGLLSLILTQEAIFSMKGTKNGWYYNGIIGISLSIIVCITGLVLIFHTKEALKSKGRCI